jgi:lipopolysaccharide biosynthesis glycosyltransferase
MGVILVVLSVFDPRGTYSRHAGVVMYSMFKNTKSRVCVHILHDNTLNEDNREKFIELAEEFEQEINFIDVSEYINKFSVNVDRLTRGFSRGSLFRLFIQDLLPADKTIYLDCDVIVEIDIKELWDIDLGECKVAAVLDGIARSVTDYKSKRKFFCRYAGIDAGKYFNSGVMVFDLKKMRNDMNLCALAFDFFMRYPYALMPDQDFLNKAFRNSVYELDRKFNYFGKDIDYSSTDNKLWHLAGEKPWVLASTPEIDSLYWRYLALTPWCNDLATEITKAWAGSKYTHVRTSSCLKKIWLEIKESFSPRKATPLYKICVIWHDIAYRIKRRFSIIK